MGHQNIVGFIDKTRLYNFLGAGGEEKPELGPHAHHKIAYFCRKMQGTFSKQTEDSQKLVLGAHAENTIKPLCFGDYFWRTHIFITFKKGASRDQKRPAWDRFGDHFHGLKR